VFPLTSQNGVGMHTRFSMMSTIRPTHNPKHLLAVLICLLIVVSGFAVSFGHKRVLASPATPKQSNGNVTVGYFPAWSIYGEGYLVKNMVTNGDASKLSVINYAFANISSSNQCQIGDAYADYQKTFTAAQAVNGVADTWNQTLAGNFNQLKELKALNPNLKVMISIGGWTWSTNFSAAASPTNINNFVNSCVDLFIKGNLPGAPGAAAGLFDGIDVDWEYPNNPGNGNPYGPQDIQNFTNLLQTFRGQLDTYGQTTGKHYLLTYAAPAGQDKYSGEQLSQDSQPTDWVNLMAYDMHGAWDAHGPTNFQDPLYCDPSDPSPAPTNQYCIDRAVTDYLAAGVPANKIVIGMPFYGRGWSGVPNANNGLYQSSTNMQPAPAPSQAGIANYNYLITLSGYTSFHNPVTQASSLFNGSTFWSFDDPTAISAKTNYIKSKGLGGAMLWSMDGDDSSGTLMSAVYNGLNNGSGGNPTPTPTKTPPPTPTPTSTSTPTPTPTNTPAPTPTNTPAPTPTPNPGGNLVTNPGFETGNLNGWSCNTGDSVVTSPVYSGSYALQIAPTGSTTGECDQTIAVQANHSYKLTAYVNGPYAYLGVQNGASNWTSTSSYTQLSVTFTTGSSQTSITIYIHGWYSQGNVSVDDVSLQ